MFIIFPEQQILSYQVSDTVSNWGLIPGRIEIILFTTASKPAWTPTQLPIQWVLGAPSSRVNGQSLNLATHLHLVFRLRKDRALPLLPHMSMVGCSSKQTPKRRKLSPYQRKHSCCQHIFLAEMYKFKVLSDCFYYYFIGKVLILTLEGLLLCCENGRASISDVTPAGAPPPTQPMFSLSWVVLHLSKLWGDAGTFTLIRRENPRDRLRFPPFEFDSLMLFFNNLQNIKAKYKLRLYAQSRVYLKQWFPNLHGEEFFLRHK
jgi:hypothetical protein